MNNLPPGVSDHDIPGNTSEDLAFESLFDEMCDLGLTASETREIWEYGLQKYNESKNPPTEKQCPICCAVFLSDGESKCYNCRTL